MKNAGFRLISSAVTALAGALLSGLGYLRSGSLEGVAEICGFMVFTMGIVLFLAQYAYAVQEGFRVISSAILALAGAAAVGLAYPSRGIGRGALPICGFMVFVIGTVLFLVEYLVSACRDSHSPFVRMIRRFFS